MDATVTQRDHYFQRDNGKVLHVREVGGRIVLVNPDAAVVLHNPEIRYVGDREFLAELESAIDEMCWGSQDLLKP